MQDLAQVAEKPIPIKYVGDKEYKTDNVNHTRTVWRGNGSVQPYPRNLAASLLRHKEIWILGQADELPKSDFIEDASGIIAGGAETSAQPQADTIVPPDKPEPSAREAMTKGKARDADESQHAASKPHEGKPGAGGAGKRSLE